MGRALALGLLGITEPESAPSAATSEAAPPVADPWSVAAPASAAPTARRETPELDESPPGIPPMMLLDPANTSSTDADAERSQAGSPTPDKPASPAARRGFQNLVEWLGVIVIAVAVALLVKLFVIQAFSIPSESMVSTLEVNDRVLVNKLSYDAHEIRRGDVVVFERPPGMTAAANDPEDLIKRVIALPGETIEAHGGTVFINGRQLIEPYLAKGTRTDNLEQPVVVPKGKIFVMGDNRARSRDSRFIGAIDEKLVVGRAFARIWPISRIAFL